MRKIAFDSKGLARIIGKIAHLKARNTAAQQLLAIFDDLRPILLIYFNLLRFFPRFIAGHSTLPGS